MSHCYACSATVSNNVVGGKHLTLSFLDRGGTLVSKGAISVGDLTSLLLYTVYVGGGLQTLT